MKSSFGVFSLQKQKQQSFKSVCFFSLQKKEQQQKTCCLVLKKQYLFCFFCQKGTEEVLKGFKRFLSLATLEAAQWRRLRMGGFFFCCSMCFFFFYIYHHISYIIYYYILFCLQNLSVFFYSDLVL